ncbi:hypothetical protein SBF1_930001 [Candidatus Desulfosporosinus infrequens]|uniref:Uncharacterized protein n=1 Tax=Candidatus Desulfosporosinus infrequens TaxID=2043169 RepID=A0A2U3LXK6_9FIRM|nr:hypothetical protein SBF1_930001 [Candidatus Desulfosporosinus infrequens]
MNEIRQPTIWDEIQLNSWKRLKLKSIPNQLLKEALFIIDNTRIYCQNKFGIKIGNIVYSTQHAGSSTRGYTDFNDMIIAIFVVNIWQEAARFPKFKDNLFLHKVVRTTLHECYHMYQIQLNYAEHERYFKHLMSKDQAVEFLNKIEQEAISFSNENWKSVKKLIKYLEFTENMTININGKYLKHY